MGANYYMAVPANNNVQGMNENSQFYNQAMMMNTHSVSPSLSSGNMGPSSLGDNSAHSNNGNYYSSSDNGGVFHSQQPQYQNYNHNGHNGM